MPIDTDLSTPTSQVRLIIGDVDGLLISDATIGALLTINDGNVNKTAIQALQAIVADLAKWTDEEVDEVKVKLSQKYDHYKDLLDMLLKDPAYLKTPISHWFGGTSKQEVDRVNNNSDSRGPGIRQGEYSSSSADCYDKNNPFFLRDC